MGLRAIKEFQIMRFKLINKSKYKKFSLFLGLIISAIFLYFVLCDLDWQQTFAAIKKIKLIYLVMPLFILNLTMLLRGLRWFVLLKSHNSETHFVPVYAAMSIGYLISSFFLAKTGDIARCVMYSQRVGISKTVAFATTLVERIFDAASLISLAAIAMLIIKNLPKWLNHIAFVVIIMSLIGFCLLFSIKLLQRIFNQIIKILPINKQLKIPIISFTNSFFSGLTTVHNLNRFIQVIIVTFCIWLSDAVILFTISHALAIQINFLVILILLAALSFSNIIPSTVGSIGVYQFIAISILMPFGVAKSLAFADIVVFQAVTLIGFAILGLGSLAYWFNPFKKIPSNSELQDVTQ